MARRLHLLAAPACMFIATLLLAAPAAAADPSLSGRWKILVKANGQERDYYVEVKQEGARFSGTFISPRSGKVPFDGGTCKDGKIHFEVKRGEQVFVFDGDIKEGKRIEGTLSVGGIEVGDVLLTRDGSPLSGKWNVVSKSPDGQEYPSTLEVQGEGDALKAKATSSLGTIDLEEVKFDGEKLTFLIVIPIDGNKVPFVVSAALKDADRLEGRWKTRDADFTGEWLARREAPAAPPAPPPAAPIASLAGKWFGTSGGSEGRRNFQLELALDGGKVSGKITSHGGTVEIQHARAEGKKLEFSFPFKANAGDVQVKVEAAVEDGEILRGKWTAAGGETGDVVARKPLVL